MKHIALALSITLLLAACDGGFSYNGHIKSSAGVALRDCNYKLEDTSGKILRGPIQINPPILNGDMTVAPFEKDYVLVLSCKDHSPYKVRFNYGSEVLPDKDLELGEVTMAFNART